MGALGSMRPPRRPVRLPFTGGALPLCAVSAVSPRTRPSGRSTRASAGCCRDLAPRPRRPGAHVRRRRRRSAAQRLAIIDLKSGDQPIYNEDRSLALVYNGEVYNYAGPAAGAAGARPRAARRDRLRGRRAPLRGATATSSCTELDGMFAFALWDARAPAAADRARPLRRQAPATTRGTARRSRSAPRSSRCSRPAASRPRSIPTRRSSCCASRTSSRSARCSPACKLLPPGTPAGARRRRAAHRAAGGRRCRNPSPGLSADGCPTLLRERFAAAVERQLDRRRRGRVVPLGRPGHGRDRRRGASSI